MLRYRAFLAVPGARRLLLSSLAARLPLGMSSLAILLLVHQQTHSFASAGLAVGAFTLAAAAASPVQGALVDRRGGRLVLAVCALVHAVALTLLVVVAQADAASLVLAVVAAAAGAVIPPVDACTRVLWPLIAPDAEVLESAYQLDATSQEVIWTLGPLLVAATVGFASPAAAVILCAVIVLAGTALFVTAPAARLARTPRRTTEKRRSALSSPGLRVVLAAATLMGFGVGAVEIGLPALAVHSGSSGAAGLLLALWSIGSMAGGFVYGTRSWRWPTATRYPALMALVALTTAPLVGANSLAAAIPLSALAGVAYAPMLSCEYGLVATLAPPSATAEAYTWTAAGLVAGIAGGSAVAGPLVQGVGVWSSFALASAITAVAAVVALAGRRRMMAAA